MSKFSNIVVLLLLSYFVRKISNFISQLLMPLNEVPDLWSDLWFNLQFRNACVVKDISIISLLEIFIGELGIASSYRCL